ncbi:MAG: prepilin peptidase [Holosporales bacterium]|jgi:prepilin signal peptidase PulO-like enzyme (type II secretory pathway)|nr:prepilin peptidase [Holosporales bacterium]
MFDGLTLGDAVLLGSAVGAGLAIAYSDARTSQIPAYLLVLLATIGAIWCVKQSYIPMSLIPIGMGVGVLELINRCWKRVIGVGDLLLFLATGLYVPVTILGTFFVLCGVLGGVTCAVLRKRACPFAPAIVISAIATLLLYMYTYPI